MPPYLTCILLTSNKGDDHRTIDLIPGKSHIVGRASRTKHGMRAAPGNAYFDSAVVSREHAELRSAPFSPTKSVTITDKKSMHGTTVNGRKLLPNTPYTLKNGDVLKFGERVSRGEEAHDGVSVTFNYRPALDVFPSATNASLPNTRGFYVPDDSEESDFASDGDSVMSNDRSSAKTTPEQQAMVGTQKRPIDLDNVAPSHEAVIGVIDGEEDMSPSPVVAAVGPSQGSPSIVPESILVVKGPMDTAASQSSTVHKPASFYGVRDSDFDDDDVDDDDDNIQIVDEADEADEASDDGEDEEPYVDYLHEVEDDIDSLNDSPEPSDDGSEGHSSENEEHTSFERQPSEELGELSMSASKDEAWVAETKETNSVMAVGSKPRYDPVRGSQPPPEGGVLDAVTAQASPAASTYMYAPWLPGRPTTDLATDSSDSTRWDLQPASVSQQNADNSSHAPLGSPIVCPDFENTANWEAMPPATPQIVVDSQDSPQSPQSFAQSCTPATSNTTSATSKGRLAIGNLCTPQEPGSEAAESTEPHSAWDSPQPSLIATENVLGQSTTNKRKADQVEDSQAVEPAANKVYVTMDAASNSQRRIAVPTSQRGRKHGLVRRIAGAAAMHTASATIGAAALAAFLTSPYAERVTEYLA